MDLKSQISLFSGRSLQVTRVIGLILYGFLAPRGYLRGFISKVVLIFIFGSFTRKQRCSKIPSLPIFCIFMNVCQVTWSYGTNNSFLESKGSLTVQERNSSHFHFWVTYNKISENYLFLRNSSPKFLHLKKTTLFDHRTPRSEHGPTSPSPLH